MVNLLDKLDLSDIEALIDNKVPESKTLDWECPPKCVKISNLKPEGGWTHEKEV